MLPEIKKTFFKTRRAKPAGFTLVDLIVSAVIIIVIFSFVLASFRTGQSSSDLDSAVKQVVDGITTVRNMSLGGQLLTNQSFPANGYGIYFDGVNQQFKLFAALEGSEEDLPKGITKFSNVEFIDFCGFAGEINPGEKLPLPCEGTGWLNKSNGFGDYLKIIFSLPDEIISDPSSLGASGQFNYVGGVMKHKKTGQQAYFYISLISGAVSGDLYDRN